MKCYGLDEMTGVTLNVSILYKMPELAKHFPKLIPTKDLPIFGTTRKMRTIIFSVALKHGARQSGSGQLGVATAHIAIYVYYDGEFLQRLMQDDVGTMLAQ